MDLSSLPRRSPPIFLADVNEDFAAMEGKTAKKKRAWCVVRFATEADNIQRGEFSKERRRSFFNPESPDVLVVTYEGDNRRRLAAREVHLLLDEVDNLTLDGQPLFKVSPSLLSFETFEGIWYSLPAQVSTALWHAVLSVNPSWSD
jgi:hypothetical protein